MFEGLRFKHWKTAWCDDGVVTLGLDRADRAVNAISHDVLAEMNVILERLEIENPKGVVVHSLKAGGFAVGADIHELAALADAASVREHVEYGQRTFERLARLGCVTVAAIHGHCMGGGTELALACSQRVAVDTADTRIGLPEIKLGIHPGWGGTARLPHLVGASAALEAMLTGKAFSARAALALGLIDATATRDELLSSACALVAHPHRRAFGRRVAIGAGNTWLARQVLAPIVRKRTRRHVSRQHYPAPFALIEVWRRGGGMRQRLEREAHSVAWLAQTPTTRQLTRLFFLQERLKREGGNAEPGWRHIHVVGAGVMGGDIAAWSAWKGFDVTLQDQAPAAVEQALERARELYTRKAHGDAGRATAAAERLQADAAGEGVPKADLLIEAIVEDSAAKQALYADLEPRTRADAVLASNTSGIQPDLLCRDLARPGRFLGLHFFNPVPRMPLVEVVSHDGLDPAVLQAALTFCRALGKLPVRTTGTPGFLVNRVLVPYLLEAVRLHQEGVPGPVLDRIAREFGMPMGPIELIDTVGLDVCASVGKLLAPFLGLELPPSLEQQLAAGKRGKKDGQGFYAWHDGKPQKPKVPRRFRAPEDTRDRLILPLLNEAVACLHDRVVDDADTVDAGIVFGTGFAPFRGGPIQYIRDSGADRVRSKLEQLAGRHGDRFRPRPGWDAAELRTAPMAASPEMA